MKFNVVLSILYIVTLMKNLNTLGLDILRIDIT